MIIKQQIPSSKKMKFFKGLQTLCLTVTAAGTLGMIVSMTGDSEKYKKLSMISSVAGVGSVLGALYAASKRTTIAFNDLKEAFEKYEADAKYNSNEFSQSPQPHKSIQPIQYIEIIHDKDSDNPYLNRK